MKFRVWSKKYNRYHDFEDLYIDMQGRLRDRDRYVMTQEENEIEYGFTFTHHEKEITLYEGDIVSWRSHNSKFALSIVDGAIGFELQYWGFKPLAGHSYLNDILDTIQVIGNIHNNGDEK